MKKPKDLDKKLLRAALIAATLAAIISCNNNQRTSDNMNATNNSDTIKPPPKADTANTAGVNTGTTNDAMFLKKAAEINLEEIRVGRLAERKGTTAGIKNMGKMLENDHAQSLNELTGLAMKKSVTIPQELDSNAQSDYRDLDDKYAKAFDKKFCDMMVNGHQDAIDLFEKEASLTTDADIKNWATKTLPVLHKHLDEAMKCQEGMK